MEWYPLSTLAATLINLALAIFVYNRGRKNKTNILFAHLLIAITVWCFGSFMVNIAGNAQSGLLWNRLLHIGAFMVPPIFIHFVWSFVNPKKRSFLIALPYTASLFLFTQITSPLFIKSVRKAEYIGYAFEPGRMYYVFIALYMVAAIYGLAVLYKTYKNSQGYRHQQAKYFLLSFCFGSFSGLVFFVLSISSTNVPPFDNFILIVFSSIFTYALFTYRLVDIRLIISKIFLFFMFSSAFLGTFTLLSSLIFWVLFREFSYTPVATATIPFAIFIGLFPPLRNGVLEYVDKLIYGGDYSYRQLVKEATEALVAILDLRELLGYLTDTISQNLKPQRLSLFLKDGHFFEVKASSGLTISGQKIAKENQLIDYIEEHKKTLLIWELEGKSTPKDKTIIRTMQRLHAEIVVPFFVKDRLTGFLAIDGKKSGKSYSPQDLEVLNALASNAAIALQNARLYEEAITDGLTGLYHHKYFQFRFEEELKRAKEFRYPLSIIMMDIDHFKDINDKHGHQIGDQVLEQLAALVRDNLRLFDIVARYGGEEFAVLLPAMGEETTKRHYQKAIGIAERIRSEVQLARFSDKKIRVTVSLGVAFYDGKDDEVTSKQMVGEADKQLYLAKEKGRNRVFEVNISKKMLA